MRKCFVIFSDKHPQILKVTMCHVLVISLMMRLSAWAWAGEIKVEQATCLSLRSDLHEADYEVDCIVYTGRRLDTIVMC